jgi:hypothetical protein
MIAPKVTVPWDQIDINEILPTLKEAYKMIEDDPEGTACILNDVVYVAAVYSVTYAQPFDEALISVGAQGFKFGIMSNMLRVMTLGAIDQSVVVRIVAKFQKNCSTSTTSHAIEDNVMDTSSEAESFTT